MTTSREDIIWGMTCHLSALCGYIVPFGNIIAPLIIWLAKRDQSSFIDDQGKEALNFQITVSIAALIAFILIFVVIGAFLLPIIALVNLILIIIAAVTVSKGQPFRYPFCLRLVK